MDGNPSLCPAAPIPNDPRYYYLELRGTGNDRFGLDGGAWLEMGDRGRRCGGMGSCRSGDGAVDVRHGGMWGLSMMALDAAGLVNTFAQSSLLGCLCRMPGN